MRKLFRFKYEPCNGTCYAWCDALPEELNKLTEERRKLIVELMVKAHESLCDNEEYSFGIDRQDESGMFVSHFRLPDRTDTYLNSNFEECVTNICNTVLSTPIPQKVGACTFGSNGAEDLGSEILRACIDIAFRKKHHDSCPCVSAN